MPIDFRTVTVPIPSGTGRRVIDSSAVFNSRVQSATVVLNSFLLDFANDDHHINVIEASTSLGPSSANTVRFRVATRYADKNFDDLYSGAVVATVIAEVD